MIDPDKEQQAYERLKSVPYSLPPAEFNWELAAMGFYSKMQKTRSDIALDEFEKELRPSISSELAAFMELEAIGIYNEQDTFDPNKADNDFYTKRLNRIRELRRDNIKGGSTKTGSNRSVRYQSYKSRKGHNKTN
tara:strand:+ start:96 stop:500 length:405 start_codon:yes stop_codon:yes gene_type:complete